jgi:hypothetical protein
MVYVIQDQSGLVVPSVTPRFAVTSHVDCLLKLGELSKRYDCHVQVLYSRPYSQPNINPHIDIHFSGNLDDLSSGRSRKTSKMYCSFWNFKLLFRDFNCPNRRLMWLAGVLAHVHCSAADSYKRKQGWSWSHQGAIPNLEKLRRCVRYCWATHAQGNLNPLIPLFFLLMHVATKSRSTL